MFRYLASRSLRALLTIILVISFAFVALRMSGDPALIALGPDAPPSAVAALRHAWGLDRPLLVQYFAYFGSLATGDFGPSLRDGRPALDVVLERLPASLALTLMALLIKTTIGISVGVYAALHRNSRADRLVMALAVVGYTVPSFVLGLIMVLVFAIKLGWFPSGGALEWNSIVLPMVTLGLAGAGVLARFTRSSVLEVLNQSHIRTAKALGVPYARLIRLHVLPNAALSVVTVLGFYLGTLLTGAVVVENVFSWPGVGRLLVLAVANRDLAVVQCILVLVSATMVFANLGVDFLHGLLDPRLRRGSV